MKANSKILLTIGLVVLVTGGVFASIKYNQRGIVDVQTGRVVRQDLVATVTASGEIKPKNYINLGANTLGPAPITEIMVKEGDRVRKGQVVAKMQSVQANADVVAQNASIATSLADSAASEAGLKSQAGRRHHGASDPGEKQSRIGPHQSQLRPRRGTIQGKASRQAGFRSEEGRVRYGGCRHGRSRGAAGSSQGARSAGAAAACFGAKADRATAKRAWIATKTSCPSISSRRRIDGIVTNLPVRAGETVVPGVQNSAASTIMTIADMSVITAEVKVDETDIVNVSLNQPAEVTIDAMPNRTFHGHVTEIGDTAILRSSGVAASQSNTSDQEAKDFKVVVALDDPPEDIRPGLSCTGKITTATKQHVLTIPIQALTVRKSGDLDPAKKSGSVEANSDPVTEKAKKEELQGVFVVRDGKAQFLPVTTGSRAPRISK